MNVTLAAWQAMWRELGSPADDALFARLVAAYSEPQRHYHTLQHLRECFERFGEVRQLARRPAEIELALWFHDAVYDVRGSDNEEHSADWARSTLPQGEVAEQVRAMILATRHAAAPTEPDAQLLVDCDLAILGASAPRFAEYEAQIRQEYAHVPLAEFSARRCRILQSFLDRPAIYATGPLRIRFEAQARRNLAQAIERWGAV